MKWTSKLSKSENLVEAITQISKDIDKDLEGKSPDLCIAFVSPHFANDYKTLSKLIQDNLSPAQFIGCSAGGLIGGGQEIEHLPAIAVTAAILPGVKIDSFHLQSNTLPDSDSPPDQWQALIGQDSSSAAIILLGDPFSFQISQLIAGLDYAFPNTVKIGGLASAAHNPGENILYLNKRTYNQGLVGIALSGNIEVSTIVSQGCKPISHPFTITKCDRNILYELDGKPAVKALHDALVSLDKSDQELAKHALLIGVAISEFKDDYKRGDFLIRNILGLDSNSGALVIGEQLHNSRTVQFQLRDASASAEDIRFLLKEHKDNYSQAASGALLFSCLGRGSYLYGQANHDSNCFKQYLGDIPLCGFFCNGEIGPVGGSTFLHGYTSSFGIFRPKPESKN